MICLINVDKKTSCLTFDVLICTVLLHVFLVLLDAISVIKVKQTPLRNPILCPVVIFETKLNQGAALVTLRREIAGDYLPDQPHPAL